MSGSRSTAKKCLTRRTGRGEKALAGTVAVRVFAGTARQDWRPEEEPCRRDQDPAAGRRDQRGGQNHQRAPPKKTDAEEIVETLTHRYQRNLRFFTDWNNEDVLQIYLTALAHVYDPHSDYLGHAQLEQFSITMNLSLFGIGAELVPEDGYCKIRRLLPGGPAIKSKLIKENDRIVAVAQSNQPPVDVVEMSLNKAVQLIRGPKGTEVRLTIIPAGADASTHNVVSIIRDEIPLEESAAKAKIIEMPDARGGNLRLGSLICLPFTRHLTRPAPRTSRSPKAPRRTSRSCSPN